MAVAPTSRRLQSCTQARLKLMHGSIHLVHFNHQGHRQAGIQCSDPCMDCPDRWRTKQDI